MAKPERADHWEDPDEAEREPWYSWQRWRWIGGSMFLALSVIVIGYGIWDEIDRSPKPIEWPTARHMLRELPPRIAGYLALAGFISFGPPAGVDLMLGATKAAERWVKRMRAKDRAEALAKGLAKGLAEGRAEGRVEGRAVGQTEGRAEGRAEERRKMQERLRPLAENHPDVQRLLEELDEEGAE